MSPLETFFCPVGPRGSKEWPLRDCLPASLSCVTWFQATWLWLVKQAIKTALSKMEPQCLVHGCGVLPRWERQVPGQSAVHKAGQRPQDTLLEGSPALWSPLCQWASSARGWHLHGIVLTTLGVSEMFARLLLYGLIAVGWVT